MLCTVHWTQKYAGYIQTENSHQTNGQKSRFKKRMAERDFPYLPTMYNHPCTIWARSSKSNYDWLYCYAAIEMNTPIDTEECINRGDGVSSPTLNAIVGLTPFAQAMPDDCKRGVQSKPYRGFYHKDKARLRRLRCKG